MRERMGIVHEHIRNDLISLEVGSTREVKPNKSTKSMPTFGSARLATQIASL